MKKIIRPVKKYLYDLRWLAAVVLILCCVHLINIATHYSLLSYGIAPRQLTSLPNILAAPFLHANWQHLINNLSGLVIFGGLCLIRSKIFFLYSSAYIILIGGLLVWLFARSNIHIGASGWVFGLWAVCIGSAVIEKNLIAIVIAFFVIAFYGSMIYGLLPTSPMVSFESHLFGAIAGILSLAAPTKISKKKSRNKR